MKVSDATTIASFAEAPRSAEDLRGQQAFEGYLVEMMVKEMRKTVPDGLFSGSEMQMFSEMLDREIATRIAEDGRLGFGGALMGGGGHTARPRGRSFGAPVQGAITSRFGGRKDPFTGKERHHAGLDIAAVEGSPVRPAKAGTVLTSATSSGYGNYVVVDHGGGWTSLYAHLDERQVTVGDHITPGTQLGTVGQTGRATGAHLHFELRRNGEAVDPGAHLDFAEIVDGGTKAPAHSADEVSGGHR